jgi:hypothetical protein
MLCYVGIRWPKDGCRLYLGTSLGNLEAIPLPPGHADWRNLYDWVEPVMGRYLVAATLIACLRIPPRYRQAVRRTVALDLVKSLAYEHWFIWQRDVRAFVNAYLAQAHSGSLAVEEASAGGG